MTIYVFDSGPMIDLFKHYYPDRFPTLWEQFDGLVRCGGITSTREVFLELCERNDSLSRWCEQNRDLFVTPSPEELEFITEVFAVEHFQAMIRTKARMKDRPVADPFVIARAYCLPQGCVVTTEKNSENAARIPNVCEKFGVDWTDLEGFMRRENWKF